MQTVRAFRRRMQCLQSLAQSIGVAALVAALFVSAGCDLMDPKKAPPKEDGASVVSPVDTAQPAAGTPTAGGTSAPGAAPSDKAIDVAVAPTATPMPAPAAPGLLFPPSSPFVSNADTFSIEGTCDDRSVVTVSGPFELADILEPAGSEKTICIKQSFKFSIRKLVDGNYNYALVATAADGIAMSNAVGLAWTRDTVAPPAPTLSEPLQSPHISSAALLMLKGGCEEGALVTLRGAVFSETPCVGAKYEFSIDKSTDGVYDFEIVQADKAGNISAGKTFRWVRDSAIPSTPRVTSPAASPVVTKVGSLTLSGSCTSGQIIALGGDVVASDVQVPPRNLATVCSEGSFTFVLSKSSDGTFVFILSQVNSATGLTSPPAMVSWKFDSNAPAAPVITAPNPTNHVSAGSSLNITGTCEVGARVNVTGAATANALCSSGTFSFSVSQAIDGTYAFYVSQTDAAGNTSPLSSVSWLRDTSIPAAVTILVPSSGTVSSNGNSITLSGICSSPNAVVLVGGVLPSDVIVPDASLIQSCSNGSFSFTVAKPLDGSYTLGVSQRNPNNGFDSDPAYVTWVRDTEAPSPVVVTSPQSNPFISGDSSIVAGGECEVGATVSMSGDASGTALCTNGYFSLPISKNLDNTYSFNLAQTDAAGNSSAAVALQWTRDTSIPPAPQITSPTLATVISADSQLMLMGSCVSGYRVTLSGVLASEVVSPANTTIQSCANSTFVFVVSKAVDGQFDLAVKQTNPNNGYESASASMIWVRDTLAPGKPTILIPASSPYVSPGPNLTISGACDSGNAVVLSRFSSSSNTFVVNRSVMCSASSSFTFTVSEASAETYEYRVAQEDLAGNRSDYESLTWIFDNTIPDAPVLSSPSENPYVSKSGTLIVSGSCVAGNTIDLFGGVVDTEVLPAHSLTQVCAADNTFSYTVSKSADGQYTLFVTQTSSAEVTSAEAQIEWTRDTQAPVAPTLTNLPTNPYTAAGNLTLAGGCESGASVHIRSNAPGNPESAVSCQLGSYSFVDDKQTVDGTYQYTIWQVDRAGNSSGSISQTWVRDSGMPASPTISSPSGSPYISTVDQLPLSGTCLPGLLVTLSGDVQSNEVMTTRSLTQVCKSGGSYSYTLQKPGDGVFNLSLKQTNAGVDSGPRTLQWIVDSTPPVVQISSTLKPSAVNYAPGATIGYSVNESGATIECRLDYQSYATCTPPSITYATVPNGTRTFYLKARDQAGNVSAEVSYSWSQEYQSTLGLYHLDALAGTVHPDSSLFTQKSDLSESTSATTSVSSISTAFGNARKFTATSSQCLTAASTSAQNLYTQTMTIEAWVKLTSAPGTSYVVASKSSGSSLGWEFRIKKRTSTSMRLEFRGALATAPTTLTSKQSNSFTMTAGTWYHVAVTWSKGSLKFYVNGSNKGSTTIGTTGSAVLNASSAPLRVGCTYPGSSEPGFIDATIDEVRLSQSVRWSTTFTPWSRSYDAD